MSTLEELLAKPIAAEGTGNVQHLASVEDGKPVALCGRDLEGLQEDEQQAPEELCPDCAKAYQELRG